MTISIGDRLGHTTVTALLHNRHGQKCATVRCDCGAEICRVLHKAAEGGRCRRCAQHLYDANGYRITSRSRVAARYAHIARVGIPAAAEALCVNAGAVWNAWGQIYPGVPRPLTNERKKATIVRRSPVRCTACDGIGHLAVDGRCSKTEHAVRLVMGGLGVRAAADRLGITNQTVYTAMRRRRAA